MVTGKKKYIEIIEVKYIENYKLDITFNDGLRKIIDLTNFLNKPTDVFKPLKNLSEFSKVSINAVGGLSWKCGADLAAEFLKNYK
jgi:hypothetical protein